MRPDREQLDERYLEGQLRDELGPPVDLSESVLRQVYARPRRVIPGPRKVPLWRPLAAAAAVLLAAGVATYSLVQILPQEMAPRASGKAESRTVINPAKKKDKQTTAEADAKAPKPEPKSDATVGPQPEESPELPPEEVKVPQVVPAPEPEPDKPEGEVEQPDPRRDLTDPPEAWPDPTKPPKAPDESGSTQRAVLAAAGKLESVKVTRDGVDLKVKTGDAFSFQQGDRLLSRGSAELLLADGGLMRFDGELTLAGEPESIALTLHDGALYADVASLLSVTASGVACSIDGVAVVEERLHGMDVFCLSGRVATEADYLEAGFHAHLEKEGFGRSRKIAWADVQREFRFLKETPARSMLAEELTEAPAQLFGGVIKDGVLAGTVDSDTGIGFYLRQPYTTREGDIVRFRFRVDKACEMILQFGTVGDSNWRHKMGGVKAGEWIEYELPLKDLYKTTDVALRAQPGLILKFFQLHPEEITAGIEIDRVEIVHRP